MSMGYGGSARLVLQDEKTAISVFSGIQNYGGYKNFNDFIKALLTGLIYTV